MTLEEKMITDLRLRALGLESSIDIALNHLKQSMTREEILNKELDSYKYTLKQLKIKCEEYEKAPHPRNWCPIHEPSEQPSVRWVTYSNFLQCTGPLRTLIAKLEDQDDGQ